MDLLFAHGNRAASLPLMDLDVAALLRRTGLSDGTPIFLDDSAWPVEPLTGFVHDLSRRVAAATLRQYAYDLLMFADFLIERGTDVLSAREEDLVAYRRSRTELQDRPVVANTWRRNASVLRQLYTWLVEDGQLERVPWRTGGSRTVLDLMATPDPQVRHLTQDQWQTFRDVGLGGRSPRGRSDATWLGWSPLRNVAGAETALTTGMRLQEFSTLLDVEVGLPHHDRSGVAVSLQACAKYGRPRRIWLQHDTLRRIDLYRRTERAARVRAAAPRLWRERADLFVVDRVDPAGTAHGTWNGRRRSYRIAAIPPAVRRLAVREGEAGLEAMALFLGHGGQMLTRSSWHRAFNQATARIHQTQDGQQTRLPAAGVRPHDLRHTFAVVMLKALMQLAHTREQDRHRQGRTAGTISEHIALNPLLVVQRLLGHASPETTMIYLRYVEDTEALVRQAFEEWIDPATDYSDYLGAAPRHDEMAAPGAETR